MAFSPITALLAEIDAGRPVILTEEPHQGEPAQGALIASAAANDPALVTFMATQARGLICVALSEARCRTLRLGLQPGRRPGRTTRPFTVSIEARHGVTTGISAADRARTIDVALDPTATHADLVSPGHVFPQAGRTGGVLAHRGWAEATIDLSRAAGGGPSGIFCQIMNDAGEIASLPELSAFAAVHGIKIGRMDDLVAYRLRHERIVEPRAALPIPEKSGGGLRLHIFADLATGSEHLALIKGEVAGEQPVSIWTHELDLLADILGGPSPDSAPPWAALMEALTACERGVILLAGTATPASALPRRGRAPIDRSRLHAVGAQILQDLGIRSILAERLDDGHISAFGRYGLRLV